MIRKARILLILGLLLPAPEAAAQYSMAVLGVDTGSGPANRAECLSNGLKRQVKRAPGFDLVPGKNLDEIKMVFGCFNEAAECMAKAGQSLQVEKLLWGRLEKVAGGYNLSVRLLDVTGAKIEKSVVEKISKADLKGSCAAEVISRLAMSILSTRRASLTIRVNVDGARITVGPRFIGLSEGPRALQSDLLPGTHNVQITAKDYQKWSQVVDIKAGEKKELNVMLQPLMRPVENPGTTPPGPAPAVERRSNLGWKIAFWTSAAATVGMAVGLGISGSQVLSLEQDKKDLVMKYRQRIGEREALPPTHPDVCSEPRKAPGGDRLTNSEVSALTDICDDGKGKALITNVLIGTTVAAAALAGFMYYKAYVSEPDEEQQEDTLTGKDEGVRWAVTPAAGPGGASLGFTLEF